MLKNRDIVCLDEATSNMDPKTDQIIMKNLFEITKNKTLIMISHRLDNLRNFDKIYVLNKGKIVECGNYTELSNNPNSYFNKLKSIY